MNATQLSKLSKQKLIQYTLMLEKKLQKLEKKIDKVYGVKPFKNRLKTLDEKPASEHELEKIKKMELKDQFYHNKQAP